MQTRYKMAKGQSSRNDQRSNSLNPNNSAYKASMENRAVQLSHSTPSLHPTSNDERSQALNSNNTTLDHNNPTYKAAMDNRSRQLNSQVQSSGEGEGK
jgi:hypothetical protein